MGDLQDELKDFGPSWLVLPHIHPPIQQFSDWVSQEGIFVKELPQTRWDKTRNDQIVAQHIPQILS